jgi:hypothetical protein
MVQHSDYTSDLIFDSLAIRSTATQTSLVADCRGFQARTIIIENGLNQLVTFQIQKCRTGDFAKPIDIGASFDVAASSNDYRSLDVYFPFVRITATCTIAPTTGTLTVSLEKIY